MSEKRKPRATAEEAEPRVRWQRITVLGIAAEEGWQKLTPGQYQHVKDLVKQLVGFGRRDYESQLRIEKFHDFWELKDKGGVLGKLNVRVYFYHNQADNEIVVLSTYIKGEDGTPGGHIPIRLKHRIRAYLNSDWPDDSLIKYERDEGCD